MIIGLDVGGTHTDVVLLDEDGLVNALKVPTDPGHLFHSVLEALEKITAGIDTGRISRLVLSTTLTTNAIAQNTIAPAGMIVSAGPGIDPEFFRTGRHYYAVDGSIDHRGRIRQPVDDSRIEAVADRMAADGIRHVGVVGKFSVRNPAHELDIRRRLSDRFEAVFLGHRLSGLLNFPRRIATTFLNAAVYPLHRDFFIAVKSSLEKKGLAVPIDILKADGGTMNFASSIDFPCETILSGPAASVAGAMAAAPGRKQCLVLDVGGTTTDMAVLVEGAPLLSPLGGRIGPHKTLVRALYTRSIAVGGDSEVAVSDGRLKIGPRRRGAAMAFGGPVPTPTDALIVLGLMPEGDRQRARAGVTDVAGQLKISVEQAAGDIFDLACRKILAAADHMVSAINSRPVYTIHEFKEGLQVRPGRILVMGGPAPWVAPRLQALSQLECDVAPRPEVANAIGAALARTTCAVTLLADTEQGLVTAPEEGFSRTVSPAFSLDEARREALKLLKVKALRKGARAQDLELEVVEEVAFNMVRGFSTTGRNIRIRAQVKPGLIRNGRAFSLKGC
jgi:N-methylhydantoinase A/oxoprolinase/acetone carboxylase beta subunit